MYIDEKHAFSDANPSNNQWQVYSANVSEGMHTFYFIYSKWNEKDISDTMAAEIEYIKTTGMVYAAKECDPCLKGWS